MKKLKKMIKRVLYLVSFVLIVLAFCGSIVGCTGTMPNPPTSAYPADILAYVTLADSLVVNQKTITLPITYQASQDKVPAINKVPDTNRYGIVEASVRNKEYTNPITQTGWTLGDKQLSPFISLLLTSSASISKGQIGTIMLVFQLTGGWGILNPAQYVVKLCYSGQQPPSYANLAFRNGDIPINNKVDVYNWDTKKATKTLAQVSQKTVAKVQTIRADMNLLKVELIPTKDAIANKVYTVDLYEKGRLRASTKVRWNQPQLNVSQMIPVVFQLTQDEMYAYGLNIDSNFRQPDLSGIFSAKIHE
jgi:hypothetical protein